LIEGHNGVYEIIVDDEVVFPNPGTRRKIPTNGEMLRKLVDYTELLPGKKLPPADLPTL
jgi:hypothetical protein